MKRMVIHELAKKEVNQFEYSNLYSYYMKISPKENFFVTKNTFSHFVDNKVRPLVTLS